MYLRSSMDIWACWFLGGVTFSAPNLHSLKLMGPLEDELQPSPNGGIWPHDSITMIVKNKTTLPETNLAPENGWLEDDPFLLGPGLCSGAMLRRVDLLNMLAKSKNILLSKMVVNNGDLLSNTCNKSKT